MEQRIIIQNMIERYPLTPISPISSLLYSYLFPIILLLFLAYGIFLLVKSKDTTLKSLKVALYIPFSINALFIVHYLAIFIFNFILEIELYLFLAIAFFSPVLAIALIISLIFSIIAIENSKNKKIPVLILVYSLIPAIYFGIMASYFILGIPLFGI